MGGLLNALVTDPHRPPEVPIVTRRTWHFRNNNPDQSITSSVVNADFEQIISIAANEQWSRNPKNTLVVDWSHIPQASLQHYTY